jgi:hypothetical protein
MHHSADGFAPYKDALITDEFAYFAEVGNGLKVVVGDDAAAGRFAAHAGEPIVSVFADPVDPQNSSVLRLWVDGTTHIETPIANTPMAILTNGARVNQWVLQGVLPPVVVAGVSDVLVTVTPNEVLRVIYGEAQQHVLAVLDCSAHPIYALATPTDATVGDVVIADSVWWYLQDSPTHPDPGFWDQVGAPGPPALYRWLPSSLPPATP